MILKKASASALSIDSYRQKKRQSSRKELYASTDYPDRNIYLSKTPLFNIKPKRENREELHDTVKEN